MEAVSVASEKTEKPTDKRLQDAREKGQVSKSQDLNGAVVLLTATGCLAYSGSFFVSSIYAQLQFTFGKLLTSPLALKHFTLPQFNALLVGAVHSTVLLLLPILLSVLVLGVLINLVQVKPMVAIEAIAPKLDKINPLNGFKRLWSTRSLAEVVKALIKMSIIGVCGSLIINTHFQELMGLGGLPIPLAWSSIIGVIGELSKWCCILFLIAGIADWRYQAWEFEKQMRMSRQDIKDERRNSEGDPMIKSRIRQIGAKMARSRQLASIPMADVVVTNPTHYAIALKYDPDLAPAPVVVAKGKDLFAQKIKAIAKEHQVPMVENRALARSLFPLVEVDAMVPPELFVAVAEVLAYVFSKNKGRRLAMQKKSAKEKQGKRIVYNPDAQNPELENLETDN
jgi:flagellar biosynthesis protein FlhB